MAVQVWVDPDYPRAHDDPALRAWIIAQAEKREVVVILRLGTDKAVTLVPPRMSATGDWLELSGKMMAPHSVGEIRRAMVEEAAALPFSTYSGLN